ncbi:hypothetical protein SAMN05444280_10453 [Tangfeifania diversioriginum]|uniref:Uncharacterized protein n=1 Tax=Tangfeifania diversioriginum TaxID=1168035 RepID=A0A1M6CQ50_9BACT|nr:hypothetical protein SAMN05444280_10453 [Tangfeifania diversioriginum]
MQKDDKTLFLLSDGFFMFVSNVKLNEWNDLL